MKTTYIIGAGCTRNYKPSNDFQSPLDKDFFDICNTIFQSNEYLTSIFKILTEHLESMFGLRLGSEPELKEKFSLETVTTMLDLESREIDNKIYIASLINLICIVFDIVLMGPTSTIHNELVRHINTDDVIISYNYDLVMDNALMNGKDLGQNMYGLNFDRKYDIGWKPCEKKHSSIYMLKLHGSMNWLKCSLCGALLFYKRTDKKIAAVESYQSMGINNSGNDLICPICQSKELNKLLIPPLLDKKLYGEEFRYLWYLAERSIISADRIVVIGYSLPTTDFYSEFLLRKALSRRKNKPVLFIVDKDIETVQKRFEKIFGVEARGKYQNLREYLDRIYESS